MEKHTPHLQNGSTCLPHAKGSQMDHQLNPTSEKNPSHRKAPHQSGPLWPSLPQPSTASFSALHSISALPETTGVVQKKEDLITWASQTLLGAPPPSREVAPSLPPRKCAESQQSQAKIG